MPAKNNPIKYDSNNYRKHSDKNKRIIKKSVDDYGAGRSILLDSENEIIAGNGVKEQWGDRPIRIIETDGTELIAVKRTDLKTNDDKRKQLALIDNHASDTSDFDMKLISTDFTEEFLNEIELNTSQSGYFQNASKNIEEFNENLIPYPITIVINSDDYEKWCEIKRNYKETNDLKMFIKLLKVVDL